jgi:hypothetical protein
MEYTTPALVQAEIRGVPFTASTVPSIQNINNWIEEESAEIALSYGFDFTENAIETYLDYDHEEFLTLKVSPVISVSSVLYATSDISSTDYNDSWVLKEEGKDYIIYNNEGTIYPLFNNWQPKDGYKRIKVIYTAGYAEIPPQIRKLCTKKVALRTLMSLINQNVNEANDGGSISVGSISIVEPAGISVNTIKELKNDVRELENKIANKSFGIYRYERV